MSHSSNRGRLAKLEAALGDRTGPRRPSDVLFLAADGVTVLWDGSPGMLPWAGKHRDELPPCWWHEPYALRAVVGIDPRVMFPENFPPVT